MMLCATCGTPMDRAADPEPFASDFPGCVEEWSCPANAAHGGYHINLSRLGAAQRARLLSVLPGLLRQGAAISVDVLSVDVDGRASGGEGSEGAR